MANITEEEAIALMRKYAPNDFVYTIVINHVNAVQKVAMRIAKKCKNIDLEFIKTASLLHDIGRFITGKGRQGINHGIIGAEILRKEGLDERYQKVCERHIGAGITRDDIKERKLPLPKKDFVPITPEEKIIAHSDNLIFGDSEATLNMVIERFRKELGEAYVPRIKKLAEDVEKLQN